MSLTILVVIITVVASLYAWSNHNMYEKWMMNPYKVKHANEYYRFVTSGFIHSGYAHLGFNMLAFYSFGRVVEYELGSIPFIIMYILGIIVSDVPTYLKFQNHSGYRSLGASGGVSAIIFASILIYPLHPITIFFIQNIPGFIFALIYLIYSYFQAQNSSDNVNHDAHFYGAVFGIIFTVVIKPGVVHEFFDQMSGWSMF